VAEILFGTTKFCCWRTPWWCTLMPNHMLVRTR